MTDNTPLTPRPQPISSSTSNHQPSSTSHAITSATQSVTPNAVPASAWHDPTPKPGVCVGCARSHQAPQEHRQYTGNAPQEHLGST